MKRDTEENRRRSRQQRLKEGDTLWNKGNKEAAKKKYAEGISITGVMTFELIKVLRRMNIEFVVAPYEADAQMAYLYKEKYVSLVITEDSDLLPFGCERVFFKLDNEGYGYEINMKDIGKLKEMNFAGFSKDMFLKMCILNGCDYLPSIKGIGLKKAYGLIKQSSDIEQIIKELRATGKYEVPDTYETNFTKAFLTFRYQTVYNIKEQCLTSLHKIEETHYAKMYEDKSFLGP
jgi:exonuclease-1